MKWLKRPLPAALFLVLLWSIWRLAVLWHTGIPQPKVHDEFSYLLQADTFAHGRLANPPPPLGAFFESPHELVRPVYASKYPPGQAMSLALGQKLFGSPFYGVPIGNALMLFTFCLMLFAWVPPRWALAVSAMFCLILSPGMYWTDSYWGGSVAASGGALVLLGLAIFRKKQSSISGIVVAIGILLLFWTRPYEGGVFTLMVIIVFARELWRKRSVGFLFAALSVLALGGVWTCYDNLAITGHPFLLPYQLHARQYDVEPAFWFQPLRPQPAYSTPRLAAFHGNEGWEVKFYKGGGKTVRQFLAHLLGPLFTLRWYFGTAILLMLVVPVAWHDPLYRKMAVVSGVFLLALGAETFHQIHYTAPVWGALALMIAIWARHAWNLRLRGMPVGAVLVVLVLISPGIVSLAQISIDATGHLRTEDVSWTYRRAALNQRLSSLGQRQLVFVQYPWPGWHVVNEWVYNSADIDRQQVVFAHDLGADQDRALLNFYPDRKAWLLTFDPVSGQEHLEPYPQSPSPASNQLPVAAINFSGRP